MNLRVTASDENGKALFCKITIQFFGKPGALYAENTLLTVCCAGARAFDLPDGFYEVTVTRGNRWQPATQRMEVKEDQAGEEVFNAVLKPLWDAEGRSLYAFDAHTHVSRDEQADTSDLLTASAVMQAEDFNFFFAGSPYDHATHLEYLRKSFEKSSYRKRFSGEIAAAVSDNFLLDIGNEIVKCRYGHIFMFNYEQTPPFSAFYDEAFDHWMFAPEGGEPPYEIAYPYAAVALSRGENTVAVAAHPTSWWWDGGKFITNIAAAIGFDILAGAVDAIVVMGYQADHVFYQALWFEILKAGYFLPGVAETDASFDQIPGNYLRFKTYARADGLRADDLSRSVKAGQAFVTSGPFINVSVNGHGLGSVLPYRPGEKFRMEIEAIRCCEANLSRVQLLVNGLVWKEYTLADEKFFTREEIMISENSFVIAKCCDFAGNAAFTNPIFIRNDPFVNVGYKAKVRARVTLNGEPAEGTYWAGQDAPKLFKSSLVAEVRPGETLCLQTGRHMKKIALFELEELQEIFRNLYLGKFNKNRRFSPGEVPPELFQIRKIRELLDDVNLNIVLDDN